MRMKPPGRPSGGVSGPHKEVRFIVEHGDPRDSNERDFFDNFFRGKDRIGSLSFIIFETRYKAKFAANPTVYGINDIDAVEAFLRTVTAAKIYFVIDDVIIGEIKNAKDLEKLQNPATLQAYLSRLLRRAALQ